jgi:hypothetical protein
VIPQVLGAVGPRTAAPRRGVLLHLGGGFIPLPASWSYVRTLTALVSRLTRQVRPGEALTVTGSAPVVAALGDLAPEPGRRIVQLSPEQMSTAVASTTVLLTLPGRSTTLEGLVSGTPTVLLPGLNYSQHRHVGVFQHWIESMPVFSWADLPGYGLLPPGLAEGAAGWQAMDLGARFHRDVRAQGLLAKWLTAHLAAPPPAPRLGKGAPWTTFDGADHVARHALALTG